MINLSNEGFVLEWVCENTDDITTTHVCNSYGLRVDTTLVFVPGTSVVVQPNKVANVSNKKNKAHTLLLSHCRACCP